MPLLFSRAADADSVLSRDGAEALANELYAQWKREKERLDRIDAYLEGRHDMPYRPHQAKTEYATLARRAVTNLCPLIVTETVQALRVDGYRRKSDADNAAPWRWWQVNGLDARQIALHDASLSYGLAYNVVLPGELANGEGDAPYIRGLSPREMYAAYADAAWDDWPMAAIRVKPQRGKAVAIELLDETALYYLGSDDAESDPFRLISWEIHGANVCPVIKFADMPDLEGRVTGQVEPYITNQDRINQDVFDRLLTQTYSSFKIRTATGIAIERDADGKPVKPIELERNRLLTSPNKDAKFGSLEESEIKQFLEAEEQDVRRLATISQTPPTSLLGDMTNLSADALVAAQIGKDNKADDRKMVYGERHEQTLRLASAIAGDAAGAQDFEAEVQWRDQQARSLAALADAYTKLASEEGLALPKELLWEKLPFLTQTDVERAKEMRRQADALARVVERIEADLEAA